MVLVKRRKLGSHWAISTRIQAFNLPSVGSHSAFVTTNVPATTSFPSDPSYSTLPFFEDLPNFTLDHPS